MPCVRPLPTNVPPEKLNRRQRDVAALVGAGCTNKDIARSLGLTPATVGNYVQQIRWRLKVKHRSQIATWAVLHGLDRPPG